HALPGDVAEQEDQHTECRHGRACRRPEHEPLDAAAVPVGRVHGRAAPGAGRTVAIRSRAIAFTASVIANSTSPISTSAARDRKSTRLNSSHDQISYAVFCLKKKNTDTFTQCITT